MTRALLLELVQTQRLAGGEFDSEIDHYVNGIDDREYAYDEVSALFDLYDVEVSERHDRHMIRLCRRLLIAAGFYRVMPQDEIDSTFRSSGRKVWDFVQDGVKYTTDHTTESWQWPEQVA